MQAGSMKRALVKTFRVMQHTNYGRKELPGAGRNPVKKEWKSTVYRSHYCFSLT